MAVDPFAEAEVRYKVLVDERREGGLPPRAFRLAVRDLAVLDSEGRRWMRWSVTCSWATSPVFSRGM